MTNYEQMAEKMYSAYCQQAGGLTFDGKPLSSFQELGLERQTCWKAAAEAAHSPDMFWDDKDHDYCLDSIDEVVEAASDNRELEIGDKILICRAISLPVITIQITKLFDEDGELALEWEAK